MCIIVNEIGGKKSEMLYLVIIILKFPTWKCDSALFNRLFSLARQTDNPVYPWIY